MSLTAESLSQFWFSEWHSLGSGLEGGIKEWIRSRHFVVNSPPASTDNFLLHFSPEKTPLKGLAYDCNRFSMSAIETFFCLNRTPPNVLRNSIPWLCIESYYAAFYSAHALLRLFGQSSTLLEHSETDAIKEITSLYHPTATTFPRGGYYNITVDTANNSLIFSRTTKRPHQHLWSEFDAFLAGTIKTLTSGSSRYQPVLLQLQSLKRNLNTTGSSGGLWLSSIREDVNYKHGKDAWYPYTGVKRTEVEKILRLLSTMPKNSLAIDLSYNKRHDMLCYFNTTNYLILLCCEIFQYIQDRSSSKVFPSYGPLKLLNLLEAK